MKPRSYFTERPVCESVMPAPYFKRAYRARDQMRYQWPWTHTMVGDAEGCYCLDRADPVTGSHVKDDYIHH
jgi:hypothetical protein